VGVGYVLDKNLVEFGSKMLYPAAFTFIQRFEKSISARGTSPRNIPVLVDSTTASV
jgi:hypothetical protein